MTVIVSTLLSAVLLLFGTGLHPLSWLTWLAPLPVLWLAPRTSGRAAFAAASLAWFAGQSRMWPYYLGTLDVPPPVAAAIIAGTALIFGLVTLAFRRLLLREFPLTAAATVPAAWAALEYVLSLALPHGAWLSLAYTQADVPPVLQTASLTGPWGITFLVMGVPSVLAAAAAPRAAGQWRTLLAGALVLVLPLAYGSWRLRQPHDASPATVAVLGTDRPNDSIHVATPEGRDLLRRYAAAIRGTGRADTVVLPEKTFIANDRSLPALTTEFGRLATERHQDIVVGLVLDQAGAARNTALAFPARGGAPVRYTKHHLIPGLEDELEPGTGLAFLSPGHGLIICKDLDFPSLVRDYRKSGAAVLFAPAWDFTDDAWLHSRMALVRGVESGLTVARAPRAGRLLVSDPYGRVLAERGTGGTDFAVVTASLPEHAVSTLYTRLGDWFAWLCLLLLVPAAAGRGLRLRPQTDNR
ncbi:nitrilase-related carbon-nitrogen hydrolase [Actinomadura rubrisoli]|uniref:Nitrilase n=1 Tax=Actinomadura rubrisoli TaxID=2530368 RepID=A0A4R4ZX34_9ACTN|nr:nitrilase-related carbon-nitrogen hydrolase [Actinomadura rubrisoli]TDD63150.1 nitrilase [Actinomadura rubrisoli]